MVLDVKNISKKYSSKCVLKDVSFSINMGEVVGFIGPNGSGKTTLLNILMGSLIPTNGKVMMSESHKMGMSISRQGFFNDMTVEKNISLNTKLLKGDTSLLPELCSRLRIDFLNIQFGKLSAGMKQKVSLLLAFIKHYRIVLLDEPTNHLDIDALLSLRELILQRKNTGCSFLITSHHLSDLEKICDRIFFLKNGVITEVGSTQMIIQQFGSFEQAYLHLK